MTESMNTTAGVLDELERDGLLEPAEHTAASAALAELRRTVKLPWFAYPFVFLGSALGAGLMTVGVLLLFDFQSPDVEFWLLSVAYMVGAVFLYRKVESAFALCLGLSFSIIGHVFGMVAVHETCGRDHLGTCLTVFALGYAAAMYPLVRDPLHRYLAGVFVFVVAKVALPFDDLEWLLQGVVPLAVFGTVSPLIARRMKPDWTPLAYACATGLVLTLLPISDRGFWFDDWRAMPPAFPSIVCAIAWFGVSMWAVRRERRPTLIDIVTPVVLTIWLVVLGEPGLLAAAFLIVLGHASHHTAITAIGLVSLPCFLVGYYHSLDVGLLTKSIALSGAGAFLLIVRSVLPRLVGVAR